jgi:ring-1,2-phenylacetyl-CoA epoxidase subunit PaaC
MKQEQALFDYLIHLGDNSLIIGHRLSEWCGHSPVLEEDMALVNFALDFIGLSRNLYTYAAKVEGMGKTEDDYAYWRDAGAYRNALLLEQPNGDFAVTIARQFFYDVFSHLQNEALTNSSDSQLSAMASKSVKESSYHLKHSRSWMLRLGDGTQESHDRLQNAVDDLWMFTGDLFSQTEGDRFLIDMGIAADVTAFQEEWNQQVGEVLLEAGIKKPSATFMQQGSRKGIHTEHLGFLLAEMQSVQRNYPGNQW